MADLEFNSPRGEFSPSPPEEYRRDEFRHSPPPERDAGGAERRLRRGSVRNRALVQAVSAAAAVVIIGNSLGLDYLGDFFGLSPITDVLETEGTAIPREYAEYLDYLMLLCSTGAEDMAISREINGETAYTVAKYLSDSGLADTYYNGGRAYSGLPPALMSDPALCLRLENSYLMKLVYLENAGSAVTEPGGVRLVETGVYGTAGSVTRAYSGTARLVSDRAELVPAAGSYTVYEGSSPQLRSSVTSP